MIARLVSIVAVLTVAAPRARGAERCVLAVTGEPAVLVSGATQQKLTLVRRSGSCTLKQGVYDLREGQKRLADRVEVIPSAGGWTLDLRGVATLEPEVRQGELVAGTTAASLQLRSARLEAGTALFVSYADAGLDRTQRRKVSATTGLPSAVAQRVRHGDAPFAILNTAAVSGPGLPLRSTDDLRWWIVGTTWSDRVTFRDCLGAEKDGLKVSEIQSFLAFELPRESTPTPSRASSGRCILRNFDQVAFEVIGGQPAPLVAHVELRSAKDADVRLRASVPLASEARLQSIPIPVGEYAAVRCVHPTVVGPRIQEEILNGTTRAIEDGALENGECAVVFDNKAFRAAHANTWALYGEQVLELQIRREGSAPLPSARLSIPGGAADGDLPQSVRLTPPPADDPGSAAPYLLELRIASDDAVYGESERAASGEAVVDPAYAFRARLRPRGRFGLPWPFRAFLTVPINFTGLRFPASPRDMEASSDSTHVQSVPLTAGLLASFEPWDYDRGTPLLTFPMRLQGGFNFVELGSGDFSPSVLVGGSITAPLLESPSALGSSLALGFYWEIDLRDGKPLAQSRFLVTFGLNLFSFFGAKPASTP